MDGYQGRIIVWWSVKLLSLSYYISRRFILNYNANISIMSLFRSFEVDLKVNGGHIWKKSNSWLIVCKTIDILIKRLKVHTKNKVLSSFILGKVCFDILLFPTLWQKQFLLFPTFWWKFLLFWPVLLLDALWNLFPAVDSSLSHWGVSVYN